MASYTPNLGLIKPAGSDNVAVQQLNTNMDVLDREVHENTERIDRIRVAAPPYIDSITKHWMVFDPETGAYEDSGVVAEAKGPYINETNGHWMIWDDVNLVFVDSGIVAVGHPASMTANATTLPAGSSATASVTGTPENPVLNIGVPRGNTGDAAGFATPSATVDANVGTPSVTVTATGPDTAKQFAFEFHNLKGRDGTIGYTPDIHIGTVESVPEGAQAEVTRTGTDEDPYLNFKLPRSGAGIGFYPIDFTIAVADWTYDSTEQRYKHEHSDNTINTRMRIVEWYIQNWDLMLGATDLIIASGKVTVWTDTIPTAAWNMHVDFATDGSEVLEELGDIDDRVDTLEGTVSTQSDQIGDLTLLNTTAKNNLVAAVNENNSIIKNTKSATSGRIVQNGVDYGGYRIEKLPNKMCVMSVNTNDQIGSTPVDITTSLPNEYKPSGQTVQNITYGSKIVINTTPNFITYINSNEKWLGTTVVYFADN